MTDWRFIRRLYGRRILRFFRAYLLLFAVHQTITIPLILCGVVFFHPKSEIRKAMSDLEARQKETGTFPETLSPRFADQFVVTTSPQYEAYRLRYWMIIAEKRPRRRTLLPFPFGMWGVYAVKPGCDDGVRAVLSDLKTRRIWAYIAEQEGYAFNFKKSFIPDVLIYAFWISAATVCIRRQKRAETTTLKRFEKFRDALFERRDQTGRFPESLEDLDFENASEYRDAFRRRELLCLANLRIGAIGATATSWRAPFAPWRFGRRTLVALEDGSIVKVRGRRAVERFYDVVWAAKKRKNVGYFYPIENKLEFEEGELPFKRIAKANRILKRSFFLSLWLFFLVSYLVRGNLGACYSYVVGATIMALLARTLLAFALIPLPIEPIASFYEFMAHTVFGWI